MMTERLLSLHRHSFMVGLALLLSCQSLRAGEPVIKWNGEIRTRGELDGRDFLSRTPPNIYALLRARLGAEIVPTEKVRIVLTLQDARVFGEERAGSSFSTIANTKNLDLLLGYVRIDDLFLDGVSVSVGRMGLSYGNERLIGTVGWNNVGRSFDGIVFRLSEDASSVDLFVMNTGETSVPVSIATPNAVVSVRDSGGLFTGFYYSLRTESRRQYDVYLLHEWDRQQSNPGDDDMSRFTAGTFLTGAFEDLRYEGEFAFQFGTRLTHDVRAYLLSGALSYGLADGVFSSVGAGFDYLSGAPLNASQVQSFDPAFHTGHKFYGFMDYFIAIPSNTFGRGLQDMYVETRLRPSPSSSILIRGHNFLLAEAWSGNRDLGQEVDVVGIINYSEHVAFEAGVSTFIPATVMRAWFNGADAAWWGYLATRVWF